jgi:hypothetical protein
MKGAMLFGMKGLMQGTDQSSIPAGPIVVLIVRAITEQQKKDFKSDGYDLEEGKAYKWLQSSHVPFDWNALKDTSYLCDFDASLSDDQLEQAFLKKSK